MDKTNAMRILDKAGVSYDAVYYDSSGYLDGIAAADMIGEAHELVYKTLVASGRSGKYYVCMLPVDNELDLKKTAAIFQEKDIWLIPVKDIISVTGYERGACSPIGMKKRYPSVIDEKVSDKKYILVSAGKFGAQIKLYPDDLVKTTGAVLADIIK